ncbi:MAG: hypothetical protein ABL959_05655 [Pyrinomonadaceae bacterium]
MNKSLFGILTIVLAFSGIAQERVQRPTNRDYPRIAKLGKTINDFVPKGFEIYSQVSGDLNGDELPDAVLYLKGISNHFITKLDFGEYDVNPRILIVLFQDTSGRGYRLEERNDRFMATPDSPSHSEPFQSMSIKNRVLQMEFELWQSMGSWGASNATYKFRYQNRKVSLIGADREDYMRNAVEIYKESYNVLTRKVKSTEAIRKDIEDADKYAKKEKIQWRRLSNVRMRTLTELGPAFSWEISRGTFL